MAGVLVPLGITLVERVAIPLLSPLIKDLFSHLGHLFGGDTTATRKVVAQVVTPVVNQLSTAGTIPGQLDAAGIEALVEKALQGILSGTSTPGQAAPAGTATITLRVVGGTIQLGL